jgi:hypothetical protein
MTLIKTAATQMRFSRRALLRGMGVSAGLLPLLNAERARAATADGFPKRIVTITWGHGVCQPLFYPAADSNPVSGQVLAPLAPYQSKVLLAAGLDYKVMLDGNHRYDGHFSYPVIFTGAYKNTGGQNSTSNGPSIDQVISDAIAKQTALPMPLMSISVQGGSTSWRAAGQNNTAENNPARLFDKLFASSTMPSAALMQLRARRKSVLDFVGQELKAYEGRMGTDDRAKIDAHFESIRQLEAQLGAMGSASCTAPTTDTKSTAYQDQVKAMCDIAAMALRCDLTRVVSMCWADDGGYRPVTLPFVGINSDFHNIAHQGPAGYGLKSKADQWFYTQVANLVKQLNDATEGPATALDHSVVVVATDMNEGANHDVGGVPFVLIGSCGGYLSTGRAVRLGTWATKSGEYWKGDSGVPHNKLLATLCNAMDVPVTGFGDAYTGTLDQLRA